MEQDEDVVEAAAQLVRQHLELDVGADSRQHVLLEDDQPLARQPDDVMVQLQRLCVARRVELAQPARAHQLLGQ